MKVRILAMGLLLTGVCVAKERDDYQKGVLLSMDSAACGMQEKGSKTVAGEILGTDGEHKKTQEVLCQNRSAHIPNQAERRQAPRASARWRIGRI